MAIIAPEVKGDFTKDLAPAGNHVARCISVIHIGTTEEESMFGLKKRNKISITWELPNETKVWKEGEPEKPYVVSEEYALSMDSKSNLRKTANSWRGKELTDEEARVFDISKFAGAACMLNVVHNPSKKDPSKVYANVASISPMPKGLVCPPAINEVKVLDYDNFDWDYFNSLSDYMKGKIQRTDEYAILNGDVVPSRPLEANEFGGVSKIEEEELPF